MSQQILADLTRLTKAIEALAERVTALETMFRTAVDSAITTSPGDGMVVKRGPGRPRRDASANGT